ESRAIRRDVERHPRRVRRQKTHGARHFQRQGVEFNLGGVALRRVGWGWWRLLNGEECGDNKGKHGLKTTATVTGGKDRGKSRGAACCAPTCFYTSLPSVIRCSTRAPVSAPDPATAARSASHGYRSRSPSRQCEAART